MSKKALQKKKAVIKHRSPAGKNSAASVTPTERVQHTSERFFKDHWKPLTIICVFALALYIQSVSFDYALDDSILIVSNKFTQQGISGIPGIFTTEGFKGYFGDQKEMVEGGRYRPLSLATFAIEKTLFGDQPGIGHFINVILYALSGFLLYRVLVFMFPQTDNSDRKWYFSIPFVAVMLFLAHPLHVEVVGNIKGRDEILALLGEAGVLYFTFRYLKELKGRFLLYSFICFFLGILSKEGVITFLAVVPVTAYFFTKSSFADKLKVVLPLVIGTILYLILRYNALGYLYSGAEITNLMNNPFYGMSFGEKTATIFYTLLLYLKLLIFPHPLTHDYYPYKVPIMHWNDWAPVLSLALYVGLAIIALIGWRKRSTPSYAIVFYLLTLSIVSNLFVSIGTFMNERFLYHASLGFCIAAAWFLVKTLNFNRLMRRVALAVFSILLLAFSFKTSIRLPDWKNTDALDMSAIKLSPNSARANYFYGMLIWNNVYMKLPKNSGPERRKAVLDSLNVYFEKALQILPSYNSANSMKAGVAAEYHKLDHNYRALIKAFEEVNRTGTYEKFVLEYLHWATRSAHNLDDAKQLAAFYERMIVYYNMEYRNTTLPGEYRSMLKEIQGRMLNMK